MSQKIPAETLAEVARFLDRQSPNIVYGEISITFVFHDGELKRVEKALLDKGEVLNE